MATKQATKIKEIDELRGPSRSVEERLPAIDTSEKRIVKVEWYPDHKSIDVGGGSASVLKTIIRCAFGAGAVHTAAHTPALRTLIAHILKLLGWS